MVLGFLLTEERGRWLEEYLYGIRFHGRGPFIMWFDERIEAEHEAKMADDKYLPAELLRLPLRYIESSGRWMDFVGGARGDRDWVEMGRGKQ